MYVGKLLDLYKKIMWLFILCMSWDSTTGKRRLDQTLCTIDLVLINSVFFIFFYNNNNNNNNNEGCDFEYKKIS